MNIPVGALVEQRQQLPYKAVLLRCLNDLGESLAEASGFLRREGDDLFLYTCWHVVTGYNKNNIEVGLQLPQRTQLEISLIDVYRDEPNAREIGGIQTTTIPLYESQTRPSKPAWLQDRHHTPHPYLNNVHLRVPFWHDAVKIKLPPSIRTIDWQIVDESKLLGPFDLIVGDRLYVVGYPYGYSVSGEENPRPVVLTRFVAANHLAGRQCDVFMDGIGAKAMSGGPVFVERDGDIYLVGMYTGLLFPDHKKKTQEMVTALGTFCSLTLIFNNQTEFVHTPDIACGSDV